MKKMKKTKRLEKLPRKISSKFRKFLSLFKNYSFGVMWNQNTCSFTEISRKIAIWALEQLLSVLWVIFPFIHPEVGFPNFFTINHQKNSSSEFFRKYLIEETLVCQFHRKSDFENFFLFSLQIAILQIFVFHPTWNIPLVLHFWLTLLVHVAPSRIGIFLKW